jgi:hypothetical protein
VESLPQLGAWLARCTAAAEQRRVEAITALAQSDILEALLRHKWDAQVYAQTCPLPRQ